MARRRFEPTKEQRLNVEAYAAYGMKQDDMCKLVLNPEGGKPISLKTLHQVFRVELDTGMAKANAKVGESLFLQAVGAPAQYDERGNCIRAEQPRVVSAGIFWAKARMGWSEKTVHEVVGKDGGPVEVFNPVDLSNMSDEQLDRLEARLTRLSEAAVRVGSGKGGAGEAAGGG